MITTTTIILVVMTITMMFTTTDLEIKRRKRTTKTATTNQSHQVHLSQFPTQYHLLTTEAQLNRKVGHTTAEFTLEVVSTLQLAIHNLMHQHQEFQTTGLDPLTLLIHGHRFHGKRAKVKLPHGQPIWVRLLVMADSAGIAMPLLMHMAMLTTTVSMTAKVKTQAL